MAHAGTDTIAVEPSVWIKRAKTTDLLSSAVAVFSLPSRWPVADEEPGSPKPSLAGRERLILVFSEQLLATFSFP